MRILIAALVTATAAALALLALAAFNLHVFVEAHRDELVTRGERALGRPLRIGSVAPSWWPIGIRFGEVVIAEDPRFGEGSFLDSAAVRVAVRPGPLLLGRLEVATIVLDRPRIALVRDAASRWNIASLGEAPSSGRSSRDLKRPRARAREIHMPLMWLGLAAIEIRDGAVDIEDRSGPRPRHLRATKVRLRSSALRLGGDARVRLEAAIFPASVRPDAHVDLQLARLGLQDGAATPFSMHLQLDDADLGTLAIIAGRSEQWAGGVTQIVADARGVLDHFEVDANASADSAWRLGPHLVVPRVPIRAGTRARVTRDAIRLEGANGAVGTLEWTAAGLVELRPWRMDLTVQSVGDSAVLIGGGARPWRLSDVALTLAAEDALRVESARARLDDVRVEGSARLAALDPLVADARVRASGFGGVVDVSVDADSASGARAQVEAARVDVGALAARCSDDPPALSGRADLSALASLPWNAARPLRAVTGAGTVHLADGRVATVNVVERVLHRMPSVRLLPRVLSPPTRERFPDVFAASDTTVRSATVPFTIADGVFASSRLAVEAASYAMEGEASVDATRTLRLHGDLVLSPELSAALRGDVPALRYLARGDGQLVFPFRIHGPLDDPIPEPDTKRLRQRGLEALAAERAEHPGRALERARRAPSSPDSTHAPTEAPVVERLERMLRP